MKSTPVAAISRTLLEVDAAGGLELQRRCARALRMRHRGAHVRERELIEQDDVGAGGERLLRAPPAISTSTSTGTPGRSARARPRSPRAIEPAAVMWFSLISTLSYRPMRWLSAAAAAHGVLLRRAAGPGASCACRGSGSRCRRSRVDVGCASRWRCRTAVCRKLSAVRSPVRIGARRALRSRTAAGRRRGASPSAACQSRRTAGSSWRKVSSTQAEPQSTAASRVITRGAHRARRPESARRSHRPLPTSSASARATCSRRSGGSAGTRVRCQNGRPWLAAAMHISIGIESTKLMREASMATLRALAFSSSVAGTMPRIFFWFGQMSPRR